MGIAVADLKGIGKHDLLVFQIDGAVDQNQAFYKIGLEETKLKQYDEAIAAFRKQLENWGDDYDTETALAEAYQAKGMLSEAKDALEKAGKLKKEK